MENKSPQLKNGNFRIANELQDAFCFFRIPGGVRQIIDCVIRKTYGYNKKEDWISNSQFVQMTGIKKGHVSRELSKAITHKIVTKSGNKLSLNKNYKEWISFKTLPKVVTGKNNNLLPKVVTTVTQSGNKTLPKVGYTKEHKDNTTKDNVTPLGINKSLVLEKSQEFPSLQETSISENITPVKKIRMPNEELLLQAQEVLDYWNVLYGKKYKSAKVILDNFSYWIKIYSVEEMKKAIGNIQGDQFWKDKMIPEIFFRQKNTQKERVDYIGRFLNQEVKGKEHPEIGERYLDGTLRL